MAIEDHDAEYEPKTGYIGNHDAWIKAATTISAVSCS